MIPSLFDVLATVLAATSAAIFILYFIYLANRDGVGPALHGLGRHLLPRHPAEILFLGVALVIFIWGIINGRLYHVSTPNSLPTLALLIVAMALCNSLQRYDDYAKTHPSRRYSVITAKFVAEPTTDPRTTAAAAAHTLEADHLTAGPVKTQIHLKTEAQLNEELQLEVVKQPETETPGGSEE